MPVGAYHEPEINELLEHGGTATRQLWLDRFNNRLHLFKKRRPKNRRRWKFLRTVRAVYPARPFMDPALERSENRLAEFWRDAVIPAF